jgi:hypothetical protein
MKKIYFGLVAFLVLLPLVSQAAVFEGGEQYFLNPDETIFEDVYVAGGDVSIGGNVTEDLVLAGGNVIVSGRVSKDLTIVGGNVDIRGVVGDDLRVAGGDIIIGGNVNGDLVAAGGSVRVLSGVRVLGDVRIAGGAVIFEGDGTGEVTIDAGELVFNGTSVGSLETRVGELSVGEQASIGGDLIYTSNKDGAEISEKAVIAGETVSEERDTKQDVSAKGAIFGFLSTVFLFKLLAVLVTAFIFIKALPRVSNQISSKVQRSPGKSTVVGFVCLIVTPVFAVLLLITGLGFVLGIITLLVYVLLILFAKVYAGIVFGGILDKYLFKKEKGLDWKSVFIGVVLLSLIGLIPVIGWIISFVIFLASLGALLQVKYQYLLDNR